MIEPIEIIEDLLTGFDEMGFVPTTTVPNSDAYAIEWKNKLTDALQELIKQSEWISVDEKLPELEDGRNWGNHRPRSIRVLCVCQQRSGKVFVKEGYYELFSNRPCWRIPGSIDSVTHWMPLPEPPKMKGANK